jgi:glycosyltransferase involved in cell wall biosynthesis
MDRNSKMKVWILQTGEPLPIDSNGLRPMRAMNLTASLVDAGHEVVLWSSNFDHFSKTHRFKNQKSIQFSENLAIKLIHSRGYKSHFGVARLFDHLQLGWNLASMLRKASPPDVAFIGYPPIETAWVMATWLKRRKVPTVLDVKDAWPEILLRAFPRPLHPLLRVLLLPYFYMMRKTFDSATSISSVTQEFLSWCETQSSRSPTQNSKNIVNYLTTNNPNSGNDLSQIQADFLRSKNIRDGVVVRGVFVGTLNSAFDFNPLIYAAEALPIEIVIAGDGPAFEELKEKSSHLKNFKLVGWVKESEAHALYKVSDFMFAPYRDLPDFEIHIPNKIFDAMANSLPLVSSITGTTRRMILDNQIGIIYDDNSNNSLTNQLQLLLTSLESLKDMGRNSKRLYDQYYSYEIVYGNCVEHLENLYRQNNN